MHYLNVNLIQKEIISKLKERAAEIGKTPTKRDIPALAMRCYNHFNSFNEAKALAGLKVMNVRKTTFPTDAFNLDRDMAKIVSYLTFDGHLYKNLSGFMFSSKNIKDIEDFVIIIKRKFNLPPKYHLNSAGSSNQTHKVFFFNKKIGEILLNLGVPKGDKVIQEFIVPEWIFSSKEFSREYLKIAYLFEGSNKENDRKNPRIQINTAKEECIINSGLVFMNQLREMLSKFEIKTTRCLIYGGRIRKKDNKKTRDVKFRIITEDNPKFMKEIGWLK
jgi:hypothetical protein